MNKAFILFVVTLLAALAAAAPISIPIKRANATVDMFGSTPLYRSYLGSVPIHNFMNAQFFGPISIGTDAKTGKPLYDGNSVIYDTGSSNLWVAGANCPSCGLKPRYDHTKSSTFAPDGRRFEIQYGSGPVAGTVVKDTVLIGGLTVEAQEFAEIEDVSGLGPAMAISPWVGICGLGFRSISVLNMETPMEKLYNSGQLADPVFAFYLTSTPGVDGQLDIGGIDESKFKGPITWVPLNSATYWQMALNGIKLGNDKLPTLCPRAIVDSGTSLLAGPSDDVKAIAKAVGGVPINPRQWLIDCKKEIPPLTFTLAGKEFVLEEYRIDAGQGVCILGMTSIDVPSGAIWILGDVFMRKYYTIHDFGAQRVGLAVAV